METGSDALGPVYPVLVVGAGPAGLTAAVTLARQGIEVLVVERRVLGSELPRATVLSVRTMEMLRSWGLERRVLDGGVDAEMSMYEMADVARAAEGSRVEVGYPTAHQSSIVSPSAPACVPQDHLESVLLEHLATLPSATVERGIEAIDVHPTSDRVAVSLRNVSTDVRRTVSVHYVVAADGPRSTIRSSLDIEFVGPDGLMEGAMVEFRAPQLWRALESHRFGVYSITEPEAVGTLLPAGPGDRWLYAFGIEKAEMRDDDATLAMLRRRIELASGIPGIAIDINRFDYFSAGAQLASRYISGRVFLVGDAAHRITPRGGTGLNTAIGDGRDLGWRLAWVLRDWASASLLHGYEEERRPVAVHNLERSADPMGTRRTAAAELRVDLGGRIPHEWVGQRSTLDLLGPGLTLFLGPEATAPSPDLTTSAPPLTTVRLPGMAARAFGLGCRGATLVRPDGVPVGSWTRAYTNADIVGAAASFTHVPRQSITTPRSAA